MIELDATVRVRGTDVSVHPRVDATTEEAIAHYEDVYRMLQSIPARKWDWSVKATLLMVEGQLWMLYREGQ